MAVRVGSTQSETPFAHEVDQRVALRRAAEIRRSGEVAFHRACNPVDLGVPSFARVSYFDFREDAAATAVEFVAAPIDDTDW
jgi:hypothetical protein